MYMHVSIHDHVHVLAILTGDLVTLLYKSVAGGQQRQLIMGLAYMTIRFAHLCQPLITGI